MKFPEMVRASHHYEPDPARADFHYVNVYMYHASTPSHFGKVGCSGPAHAAFMPPTPVHTVVTG